MHSILFFPSKLVDWIWLVSQWSKKCLGFLSTYKPSWVSIVFVSKHQTCQHNRNFCGNHNLLLLLRSSLFFVLHTWACWDVLCTNAWLDPRYFASGSIAHTKFCLHFCNCHLPSQIIFLKSSYLMDFIIFSFYFIFPFQHGQEKESDLGIKPNQLSIRNCEDG